MYLNNVINNIFLTASIIEPNETSGGSFLPFLGFVMCLVGFVMIFIGLILASAAKKEWNVFYAPEDKYTDDRKVKNKIALIRGRVVCALGVVIFAASFFVV